MQTIITLKKLQKKADGNAARMVITIKYCRFNNLKFWLAMNINTNEIIRYGVNWTTLE